MFSNIKPSSEESFFLQSYHYNLFMKLACDVQIGLKNVYDSILSGNISNNRTPQVPRRTRRNNGVDYNNRAYWENRLRDLIHETIPKLTNYSIQCVTLGFPLDFSYEHYSSDFYTLRSSFSELKIEYLVKELNCELEDNEIEIINDNDTSSSFDDGSGLRSASFCSGDGFQPTRSQGFSQTKEAKLIAQESFVVAKNHEKEITYITLRNVILIYRNDVIPTYQNYEREGTIILTSYKLCFIDSKNSDLNVFIPLMHSADYKKINQNKGEHRRVLEISTKLNVFIKLSFNKDRDQRKMICELIDKFVFIPANQLQVFKLVDVIPQKRFIFYDLLDEFIRQGLASSNSNWRVSRVNDDYKFCPTYPREMIVPKEASDELLVEVGKYRSRQRIPVTTWVHSNGAAVSRCSQPLPGITMRKSQADIDLLKMLADSGNGKLHILDSRPKANAIANIAMGGGYESEDVYTFAKMEFENIDNIHVVREAWIKLSQLCLQSEKKKSVTSIQNSPEGQQWWKILMAIFLSTIKMCKYLEKGESVLVHCTDGWDRTSQCCSLCEIMLDPFYRTIDGFIILLEKDWKSFGHQFEKRSGVGAHCPHGQYSPVFHQFIECLYILIQHFPTAFEYNEELLFDVDQAVYCNDFGTFMFNRDEEREIYRINERTPSLWSYVTENRMNYRNEKYSQTNYKLHLGNLPKFVLWEKYYFYQRKLIE